MKRFIALMLALLCCVGLMTSCGKNEIEDDESTTPANGTENTTANTTAATTTNGNSPEGDPIRDPALPDIFQYGDDILDYLSASESTGRDAGLPDNFEFTPKSYDDRIKEGTYTKVSEIDSKYVSKTDGDVTFLRYSTPQLELAGIKDPAQNGGEFYRLDVSKRNSYISNNVFTEKSLPSNLACHTSGVTLRFRTNAPEITINATLRNGNLNWQHMTVRNVTGFDVYVGSGTDRTYYCGKGQVVAGGSSVNETIKLTGDYTEVLIMFPLYGGVKDISIGFPSSAEVAAPLARDHKPVVFYGSSITHGCSASRPGLNYTNIVCRMLNVDCINQGYSSGAHLEPEMADYIASMDMSAFVMDNDGNGSNDTLNRRHYAFYKTIREAHPDIPIILVTRPVYSESNLTMFKERQNIIKATYDRAVREGDENIYYINGYDFFPVKGIADVYAIDHNHPTDTGMYYMAMMVYQELNKALNG